MSYVRSFAPDRLRAAREALGLTQERTARALDVPLRKYARWETGEGDNSGPKGADLLALSDVLGVTPESLYREVASGEGAVA